MLIAILLNGNPFCTCFNGVLFQLTILLSIDDVIDETYGVAVVFHEDDEEVCHY